MTSGSPKVMVGGATMLPVSILRGSVLGASALGLTVGTGAAVGVSVTEMMWVGARGGSAPFWRFSAVAFFSLARAFAVVTVGPGAGSGVAWATGVAAIVVTRSSSAGKPRLRRLLLGVALADIVLDPAQVLLDLGHDAAHGADLGQRLVGKLDARVGLRHLRFRCEGEKSCGCHAREAR